MEVVKTSPNVRAVEEHANLCIRGLSCNLVARLVRKKANRTRRNRFMLLYRTANIGSVAMIKDTSQGCLAG